MTVLSWLGRGVAGGAAVLLAAGCGGDGGPEGYGADHRAGFVDDCTTDVASAEACGCFYDRMADSVPFDRFLEVDESRKQDDAATNLPVDIASLAAGCTARAEAEARAKAQAEDADAG